jgi:hypothetical protein
MEAQGSESALQVLAALTLTNCVLVAFFVRMTRSHR